VEYVHWPYFPKGARIWIWGATGTYKSLYCAWIATKLSHQGIRVSYFSEENPLSEELRRLGKLRPDPSCFRMFHRTGMDLTDPQWVKALLETTQGDGIIFLDSFTDLWSGDEQANREIQQFDATVLKALQAKGVTPVVLDHTGHQPMFSNRGGATAGRGASSKGQKADVTLEFKTADEEGFSIVYGKCRIGGVRQPERTFRVEDVEEGGIDIVEAGSPQQRALSDLAEKMAQAILTSPTGWLTTTALRKAAGGKRDRQPAALGLLQNDPRVVMRSEKIPAQDGKLREANVWRPAGHGLGEGLDLAPGEGVYPEPLPLTGGGEGFTGFPPTSPAPDPESGEGLGPAGDGLDGLAEADRQRIARLRKRFPNSSTHPDWWLLEYGDDETQEAS
jgi:hypothetical protein